MDGKTSGHEMGKWLWLIRKIIITIPSWWSHMCTDLRAPLTAFNKLNGSLYSKAMCLPLPWRSPAGEEAEPAACGWDQWAAVWGWIGCPREELSPALLPQTWGTLGSPMGLSGTAWAGAAAQQGWPGRAGCAHWHISSQMTFREHKSHSLLQPK